MLEARCKECGAPIYTRVFRQWNQDGTVTGRFSQGIRICHIEQGEINALVEGISGRIGYPIDRIVVEGERKASRAIMNETLSAGKGILGLFGRAWGGKPVTLKLSLAVSRSVGNGAPEVLEYKRSGKLRLRVRGPFCTPVVVGEIWGMFETLHSVTARAEWEPKDEHVMIDLEKVRYGTFEEYPDRLELQKLATLPGKVEFDRCRRCGIPREVTRSIEWDLDRGIVTNKRTGRREVTIMVESLNAIIRELSGELGDEIPSMVQEIEQEYVSGVMKGVRPSNELEQYRSLLEELRVMGMGNPTEVEKVGEKLTVKIENPFCEPMLAGRVGGYYKALEGGKPKVTWTPDTEGFTIIEAEPD